MTSSSPVGWMNTGKVSGFFLSGFFTRTSSFATPGQPSIDDTL
jgi:hypothetical protein